MHRRPWSSLFGDMNLYDSNHLAASSASSSPLFRYCNMCLISCLVGGQMLTSSNRIDTHCFGRRRVMREILFVLAILVVAPIFAFSQSPKPRTHTKITGCLTSTGDPDGYQLVDEKGITNLVYSATLHLDSYVGRSVTLTGDQSATPSTDTGTARPMPHFRVLKVHPAAGNCKK